MELVGEQETARGHAADVIAASRDGYPRAMKECEVCGNEYDKAFEVVAAGQSHVFDSFECAIHAMAPICEHCGCKVIGHGTEVDGRFFCSRALSA